MRVRPLEVRLEDAAGDIGPEQLKAMQRLAREQLILSLLKKGKRPRKGDSGYLKGDAGTNLVTYFEGSGMDLDAYGGLRHIRTRLAEAFCKDSMKQAQYGAVNGTDPIIRAAVGVLDPFEASYMLAGVWGGKVAKKVKYRFSRDQLDALTDTRSRGQWLNHPLMAVMNYLVWRGKSRMEYIHRESPRTSTRPVYPEYFSAERQPEMAVERWTPFSNGTIRRGRPGTQTSFQW